MVDTSKSLKRKSPENGESAEASKKSSSPGSDSDQAGKKRRVIGPALPPSVTSVDGAKDSQDQDASSSSSNDDFGPALPGADDATVRELSEYLIGSLSKHVDLAGVASRGRPCSEGGRGEKPKRCSQTRTVDARASETG